MNAALDPARFERILCWMLGSLCILWFFGWLPQYLTWPLWLDLDTFAWLAQGWTSGTVPYRDVRDFNFPGQIYIFLCLGSLFGWGRTAPIYAFDAALLAGFLALLLAWSRSRLERVLPAWFAATALLSYYLNLEFHLVAQRDWHAALLAVAALLLLQLPGRRGLWRLLSAILMAAAFSIRPHVLLLVPAILLALWLEAGAAATTDPGRTRRQWVLGWLAAFGGFVVIAFLPLIASGLLDDLLTALRAASYGSRYAQRSRPGLFQSLLLQTGFTSAQLGTALRSPSDLGRSLDLGKLALLAVLNLAWLTRTRNAALRVLAAPWILGLGLLFLYEPIHPLRHAYLAHPLRVIWAVNLALFLAGWRPPSGEKTPVVRWLPLLLAGLFAWLPGWPRFWSPLRSIEAWSNLARNQPPARVPLGAQNFFAPGDSRSPYRWEEYRQALDHLRHHTRPNTLVANLLRNVPFPAINGPAGRVSPLTAGDPIPYLWTVDPEIELEFAQDLANAPSGTVVVWDPDRPSFTPELGLVKVGEVVRRQYRPEVRFGVIEIWRKR